MPQSPNILIISFSLSGQTTGLLNSLTSGLAACGCRIHHERLQPVEPLRFPFGTIPKTLSMMLRTFFRQRVAIRPLGPDCHDNFDMVIIAGPTWSYNPSGPMLSFFDRNGARILRGKEVIPLISCRGYWRMHLWGLKRLIRSCGARVVNTMIFSHPTREPWRTLGVFLKLSGRHPEKMPLISRHYHRYGHDKEQQSQAEEFGRRLGSQLVAGGDMAELSLHNAITLP